MWNERYAREEFVYGTEPNTFLVEQAGLLQGPILSLAEGEGRNAVYLASRGFEVLGVDASPVGLAKAEKLAATRGVLIRTEVADLANYSPAEHTYGAVVSIFAHLPSVLRQRLYPLVARSLKPGGVIVLEAYSKSQLARVTGGPKDADMLLTCSDLEHAFPDCEIVVLREIERDVQEGSYHTGIASVVQFVARKALS